MRATRVHAVAAHATVSASPRRPRISKHGQAGICGLSMQQLQPGTPGAYSCTAHTSSRLLAVGLIVHIDLLMSSGGNPCSVCGLRMTAAGIRGVGHVEEYQQGVSPCITKGSLPAHFSGQSKKARSSSRQLRSCCIRCAARLGRSRS